jgi:hypothetical protein
MNNKSNGKSRVRKEKMGETIVRVATVQAAPVLFNRETEPVNPDAGRGRNRR